MKIWLDKTHGLHYHKDGCGFIDKNPPHPYEEIEHQIRRQYRMVNNTGEEYATIKVGGRYYIPCPFCFGYEKRK